MTSKASSRPSPVRRRTHRNSKPPRKRVRWFFRLAVAAVLAGLALFGIGAVARHFAPISNTSLSRFDAIIVLGNPADDDGNPRPEQLARVTEGVREYERGVAPRLILTGGPTNHGFVESRVMARTAQAQGIPASAIFQEPTAMDTIHNACYAVRIMKAHGWHSAEVVSNPRHLPRAGLIFNRLPIEWRAHAAPSIVPMSEFDRRIALWTEDLKTTRYLIWARYVESCEP